MPVPEPLPLQTLESSTHEQSQKIIIKEVLNEIIESVIIPKPKQEKKTDNNQKQTIYFIKKISKINMRLF